MANGFQKFMHTIGFSREEDYGDDYQEQGYEEVTHAPQPVVTERASGMERFTERLMSSARSERNVHTDMRIGLIQPLRYDDAQHIARDIRLGKVVVFDLSQTSLEVAVKIVDFVSGAIFALDGTIQKVNESEAIFVAVPPNVALDNELRAGLGERVEDYSPRIADWVNHTRNRGEF